jgi:hypothetical protein
MSSLLPPLPPVGYSSTQDVPGLPSGTPGGDLSNYSVGNSPLDVLGDQSALGTSIGNPTVSSSAVGTTTGSSNANTLANPGGTNQGGNNLWSQLGAWLKSIALSGTLVLVALLLIIFTLYVLVTKSGAIKALPSLKGNAS